MQVAIAKRAFPGEPHCGDQCGCWQTGTGTILCVADGLGHGEEAQRAAKAAVDYVGRNLSQTLVDLFAGCDLALKSTRGVAMGIAVVDEDAVSLTYAGVGNTWVRIVRDCRPALVEEEAVRPASNFGIVGAGYSALRPQTVPLAPGDLVVLGTERVEESVNISGYDNGSCADLKRLAERILRESDRQTDDAAVLLFKRDLP